MELESDEPKFALLPSYLSFIQNSVGSGVFKNRYYKIKGQVIDVTVDGDLSCAEYVSNVLCVFGLIDERHTTVKATIESLKDAGWRTISSPRAGAIIWWGFKKKDNGTQGKHHHVGFYIDQETAISNDSDTRVIASHHPTYGTLENGEPRREILKYFWHDALED